MLALIIFTGAAVRLTQSGLGCEDWPTCNDNQLVPAASFHGWIEFGNRLLSGAVAASVAAAVLTAYRRSPRRADLVRWAWGLVAGVLGQIFLGGATVLVDLHPAFVAAHYLLSAILMWNSLVLISKASGGPGPAVPLVPSSMIQHGRALVILAATVLVTGTVVTGSGPHSGDARAARFGFHLDDVVRIHSVTAWFFVATTVTLVIRLAPVTGTAPEWRTIRRNGQVLLAATVAQGTIGYWQFFTGVPAGLVQLHVMGSVAVWCAALWLHLSLSRRPEEVPVSDEIPTERLLGSELAARGTLESCRQHHSG